VALLIGGVDATAYLSYGDLPAALGLEVSRGDEPGRGEVATGLPLAGDVTVSAAVSAATGNRIVFMDVRTARGELLHWHCGHDLGPSGGSGSCKAGRVGDRRQRR